MRKNVYGRQFKRDVNERKALFKSLLSELVLHERIQTTVEKAKAIQADADRLITKAKYTDRTHALALLQPLVTVDAVSKLLLELGPRFQARKGGYTRIIKLGRRFNDNAQTAFIEWTETRLAVGRKNDVHEEKKTKVATIVKESEKEVAGKQKTSAKKETKAASAGKKTSKKQEKKEDK